MEQTGPLSLVEECRGSSLIGRELPQSCLCQQSYAIKNHLGHPKPPTRGFGTQIFLLLAGSIGHKGAYNRTFPCMEANYPIPYDIKNRRGAPMRVDQLGQKDPAQATGHFLASAGSLLHKDKCLPGTERIYYVIEIQRKTRNAQSPGPSLCGIREHHDRGPLQCSAVPLGSLNNNRQ